MKGYDLKLVRDVAKAVSIPVIACGGAGTIDDLKRVLVEGQAHAAAGSLYVFFGEEKAVLITAPEKQKLIGLGIYSE